MEKISPGAVVLWRNGPEGSYGVVEAALDGRVTVHLDSGESMQFVWPTPVLERVSFPVGSKVQTGQDDSSGVVVAQSVVDGLAIYQVNLASGATKTVVETGLRPALVTDPIDLLRTGGIDLARKTNLRISATRIRLAHHYDELSSLANSRVEIKEHQVAVVHRVATTYPHRFILADEVGLGKTIEAGLILKELRARGVAKRVLILVPAGIVSQWQYELRSKFNEPFAHYNRATMTVLQGENPGENVWTLRDNVIASTSYAAWDETRRAQIALAGWDVVIIDEAHHARRTREGVGRYRSTNLYRLAEALADPDQGQALGYLLLTATPMQLDPFELYSMIELLDPTLFADELDFEDHRSELAGLNATVDRLDRWSSLDDEERALARDTAAAFLDDVHDVGEALRTATGRARVHEKLAAKHRLSDVLIRNRKATVGGFMPRRATVWPVDMTELEREAYDAVTTYCRTGYARSRAQQNNTIGFLMAVFQKLNSSSSYAIRQSLLRRIEKLALDLAPSVDDLFEVDQEELEDELEESTPEDVLEDAMGARTSDPVEEEITELSTIVQLLDRIETDSKASALQAGLDELLDQDPEAKVLVFTQSRDTQDYLARQFASSPWEVHLFHGQLKPEDKDRAVEDFRDGTGPQLLVSTEAGGEGRNFQFCHNIVNYDLPWNPMKVEQRIGRVDRIGQKHEVRIFNFSVVDTIEERVLDVLSNRIRVFEETIGGLDPILGSVESDLKKAFSMSEEEEDAALAHLDEALESKIRGAREAERKLADLIMDTKSYRKDEVDQLLGRLGPVDSDAMKRFTLSALYELGVGIERDERLDGVYELRLKGRYGMEFPAIVKDAFRRRVTFDPAVARDHEDIEFLAIGHEIVDSLLERCQAPEYGGRASIRLIKTDDAPPVRGWFFTFILEFEGVQPFKEVLPVFVDESGNVDEDVAEWLHDRALRVKREDWREETLPDRGDAFESAVQTANTLALTRLLAKQTDLEVVNRERADKERDKLERYYAYKQTAAESKLDAVKRTLERLSESDDPDVQRILPVWRKNLENAERAVATVGDDRERRLRQLKGRETVTAQTEALTASWVEVAPDGDQDPKSG